MHRITYSLTLRDLFLQHLTLFKVWLIALSIDLLLVTWYVYSLHSICVFMFHSLPDEIAGLIFIGLSMLIGGLSGGLISVGLMVFIMTLVTYRRVGHKLKDFTVTLSEQSLSVVLPDIQSEIKWNNVLKVRNSRHLVLIIVHYPLVMTTCLMIPRRAFQSDQEAEAFGKAAEQYWKQAKGPARVGGDANELAQF